MEHDHHAPLPTGDEYPLKPTAHSVTMSPEEQVACTDHHTHDDYAQKIRERLMAGHVPTLAAYHAR